LQRVGYATVGIEIRGIPPFAKSAKDGAPGDFVALSAQDKKCPVSSPRVGDAGERRTVIQVPYICSCYP
jgi:hypothetical protein